MSKGGKVRERYKPKTEQNKTKKKKKMTLNNNVIVTRGERGGRGRGMAEIVDGDKNCTCHDEHWVLYGIVESLYHTPETNITLYVNQVVLK